MSAQMVRKWCQQFKTEWELIDDEHRAEYPIEVSRQEQISS